MKVLFLDIDGVLNSFDNMHSLSFSTQADIKQINDEYGTLFDERCVRWLDYIIKQTDCKIVISSTWRISGLPVMQEMWKHRNLPGEVIGVTPTTVDESLFKTYNWEEADRGYEIQEWLNNNEVDSYCIIDDEDDMLKHQNFVRTNGNTGLNFTSTKYIVETLNT